ncbi:MAG: hypothetical protein Q8R40_06515 [bacterium]|nr:hypothetical protein [bacterium]
MNVIKKISPEWALRLGLGLMYLYSGYDLIVKPSHWYGFVPQWFSQMVTQTTSVENYLRIQGMGEGLIGVLFLAWFLPRYAVRTACLVTILEMSMISLFVGIDPITFRDIGLLGAALALFIMTISRDFPKEISGQATHSP